MDDLVLPNAPNIFGGDLFEPLERRPVPQPPAGFNSYINTFMRREEYEAYFAGEGYSDTPRLQHHVTDDGFRAPSGLGGEINGLVNSAYDRLGHGLEPLFSLAQAPPPSNADENQQFTAKLGKDLKLIGMAMGQAMAQLAHVKRYLVLRETWGASRAGEAKAVLKKAYKEAAPFPNDKLFGAAFAETVKSYGASAAAPPAITGPARVPAPVTYVPRPAQYKRSRGSNFRPDNNRRRHNPYPSHGGGGGGSGQAARGGYKGGSQRGSSSYKGDYSTGYKRGGRR